MKTRIKRSELYAKVWQTPMTRLAKEFDISDVGLAKACKRHDIPTPRAGYWAKHAHGKAPVPTPLPVGEDVVVQLEPSIYRLPPASFKSAAVADAGLIAPVVSIATTEEIGSKLATHSSATHAALKKAKPDESGFLRCRSSKAFTCVISPGTRDRAVRLLDAVERTVNNIGGHWKSDGKTESLVLEFDGEPMQLSLTEQYKRTEQQVQDPKRPWYTPRTFVYHFSGELTLTLEADYRGRRTWSDGKRSQIEDKLSEFAAGVQNAAKAIKELRDEREAQQKRWAEEARLRQEAETKARHFKQFKANLLAEANVWSDFQRVSEYVAHLETQLARGTEIQGAAQDWMRMAKACATSLDPSNLRVKRLLQEPPDDDAYHGPFGRPIV